MPSKRDPPADSSSSSSEEEEEEEAVEASQDAEEDEEDDAEEEEVEDPTPLKPSKPTPTSNSTPQKQPQPQPQPDSSDSDESDSDDDETDSPTPTKTKPQTPAPLDIKPISSKPMPSSSSSAKPQSQRATVMGLASLSKRPAETDSPRKDKNKKKKKVSDLVDDAEQNDHNNNKKNNMFQRIWTEEDEIAILKCMISCKKKGMDVLSQPFVDTLKDSLQMKDVSKTQVRSKIRTLKKKFQNASKKPNPGENLKPHDAKVYVLSKKFWNEEIGKDEKVPDAPISRVTTLPNNNNNSTKTTTTKEGVKDDGDKKSSLEYMYLSESSVAPKFPLMPVPPLGLGDIVSKKGWDVIGGSKAQKLDQKWKNVIIAETKAYLQRLDLVKEQTQAMLDALESSNV